MSTKYPKEVAAVVRKSKALAVNAEFTRAESKNGDIPLAIYDKSFSRLVLSILDTESTEKGKGSSTANISVPELAEIFAISDYAFQKHMDATLGGNGGESQETLSPAYTYHFPEKSPLKGMTAAEYLLANGAAGFPILQQQHNYLQQNLNKYPRNAQGMQALEEAATLYNAGQLKNVSRPTVVLYDSAPRPKVRKARQPDGFCPVYQIVIKWVIGSEYPVSVNIQNFYAPVAQKEGGRVEPQVKNMDRSSLVNLSINCSTKEWLNVIRAVKSAMRQFEIVNAQACVEDSENAARENRQAAGYYNTDAVNTQTQTYNQEWNGYNAPVQPDAYAGMSCQ